jgi:hypothetical protein
VERPRRGSTARRRGVTDPPRPASAGRVHRQHGYPAMTHFTPGGGPPAALPTLVSRPEAPAATRAPSLDRNRLREAIAVRRQRASPNAKPISLLPVRRLSPTAQGGTSALTTAQPGTAPRGTATSGWRRGSNPSSCPSCSASSGTSSGWNDWPHSARHPRRPQRQRLHGRTGEMERCAEAQAPHRRLSPRVDARSKPVSVPLPYPRFAVQARTRACHDRRSAFGSRRFRVAPLPRRPQCSGAGRSRHRFPLTAPEGTTPAWEPAPVLRGTTEGMKRCPDSSTACN